MAARSRRGRRRPESERPGAPRRGVGAGARDATLGLAVVVDNARIADGALGRLLFDGDEFFVRTAGREHGDDEHVVPQRLHDLAALAGPRGHPDCRIHGITIAALADRP